jgi:3-oxoacyl-[acyl-carrier protein] reductase
MEISLKDKAVIVTGAAGTIGAAAAHALLVAGAQVVLADCAGERLKNIFDLLPAAFKNRTMTFGLDLRSDQSVKDLVAATVQRFGRIDSLICNAATFAFEPLEKWPDLGALDTHYQVGLRGHTNLVREAWKQFPASKGGSVVTVSSVAGHIGEPHAFAYSPIKAALKGLTLSCAIDMAAEGGWAVTLSPGHTWSTPHQQRAAAEGLTREEYENSKPNIQSTMFGKFLEPDQVGQWITLLASPLGKPLTGQDLHLTNGIEAGGFNRKYKTAID